MFQRLSGTGYRFGNRKCKHRRKDRQKAFEAAQPHPASAEAGVIDDNSDDDVEEIQEATENVRALRDVLLMARNTSSEE